MLVSALYGGRQLYSGSAQACSSLCSCSSAKGRTLQCIGQQCSGKGGEARREGGQAGITAAFPRSRAQIGTCPAHDHHHHGDGEDDHDGDNDGDSDGDDDGDGDGDKTDNTRNMEIVIHNIEMTGFQVKLASYDTFGNSTLLKLNRDILSLTD